MATHFLENEIALVLVAFIAIAVPSLACNGEDEVEEPEDVATAFLDELRRGDQQAAMDDLWPPTRNELEALAEELEEVTDGDRSVAEWDLIAVTRLESSFLFASIDIEGDVPDDPVDAEEVALTLEYRDGRTAEIIVRWSDEDQRWYVDLPLDDRRSLHQRTQVPDSRVDDLDSDGDDDDDGDDVAQPVDRGEDGDDPIDSTDDETMNDE